MQNEIAASSCHQLSIFAATHNLQHIGVDSIQMLNRLTANLLAELLDLRNLSWAELSIALKCCRVTEGSCCKLTYAQL